MLFDTSELEKTFLVPQWRSFLYGPGAWSWSWTGNWLWRRRGGESRGKKEGQGLHNQHYCLYFFQCLHTQIKKKVNFSKTCLPVQHVIVLQILCSPATLHIFNHMILQKLLQELHCLLSADIRSEVAVAPEQLVQPIHGCRGHETGGVVPEVLPVFPEGHSSPKETSHFIPLKKGQRQCSTD